MPDRPEPREVVIVTAGGALTDDDVAQVRRAYEAGQSVRFVPGVPLGDFARLLRDEAVKSRD